MVNGVIVLPEAFHHSTLHRPWQPALVGGEFVGKLGIDNCGRGLAWSLAAGFAGRSLRRGRLLADKLGNASVQGLLLAILLLQLGLILLAVLVKLRHQPGRVGLFPLQLLALEGHFAAHIGSRCPEPVQPLFLDGQLCRHLPKFHGLAVHIGRQAAKITCPPEPLADGFAGEDVHVPQPAVAVFVRPAHQPAVVEGQRVVPCLEAVHLTLADAQRIVQKADGGVAPGDELFARLDLASQ